VIQSGSSAALNAGIECDCTHATLKLEQTQPRLEDAQKVLEVMARDRQAHAFDVADNEHRMSKVKKEFAAAKLLSRSQDKSPMERLKARKRPFHSTGLTWSPSRVDNRAARPGCMLRGMSAGARGV
jgi:hypothetical protein